MGGVVRLGGRAEAERFLADADALAAAFRARLDTSGSPFLPAYPGQAWPGSAAWSATPRWPLADHLHDRSTFDGLIERWWRAAEVWRDPATGRCRTAWPSPG